MKNFLKLTLLATFMISAPALANDPKQMYVRLDVSRSNPLVTDEAYAQRVARRIIDYVLELNIGDRVNVRVFGDMGRFNGPDWDLEISRRSMPKEKVARNLATLILSLPNGGQDPHDTTEILSELKWTDWRCQADDIILLATDGIETGDWIKSTQAILDGRAGLPIPAEHYLQNCHVVMIGIGAEIGSSSKINNLITAWRAHVTKAGGQFTAIPRP